MSHLLYSALLKELDMLLLIILDNSEGKEFISFKFRLILPALELLSVFSVEQDSNSRACNRLFEYTWLFGAGMIEDCCSFSKLRLLPVKSSLFLVDIIPCKTLEWCILKLLLAVDKVKVLLVLAGVVLV